MKNGHKWQKLTPQGGSRANKIRVMKMKTSQHFMWEIPTRLPLVAAAKPPPRQRRSVRVATKKIMKKYEEA
jgi:hypothetical protein